VTFQHTRSESNNATLHLQSDLDTGDAHALRLRVID